MKVPFNDLKRTHARLLPEFVASLERVVGHSEFILGKEVAAFEEAFSQFTGSAHTIACTSGTDALTLILLGLDIGPGDEVICPAQTFIATLEGILAVGARPVLVDCQPDTGLMDPASVRAAITPKTRAIVPVHLYGQVAPIEELLSLSSSHGVHLIEDAAQAHGSRWRGRHAGTFGKAGAFSFFPGKNLGALGDAGGVTTQDASFAERLRKFRDHGRLSRYEHAFFGRNFRMDAVQGAWLKTKLSHLPQWHAARLKIAARFCEAFQAIPQIQVLPEQEDVIPGWHLFIVQHEHRDAWVQALNAEGIEARVHYGIPSHRQPAWAHAFPKNPLSLPRTERWASRAVSLPLFETMTDVEVDAVIRAVVKTASVSA